MTDLIDPNSAATVWAAIGSGVVVISGLMYKSFRLIKQDLFNDAINARLKDNSYIHIPKDLVRAIDVELEDDPLKQRIKDLRKSLRELENADEDRFKK